jgi:glycine/D-amino acid oxidase-like deaminating enzyme
MARVAVVGAGFVGLSSAYWLMRDGHQVSLYEPRGAAGGASFGNAGTFANYACIPVNNPSVFRDLPRYLFASQSPLRVRWSHLHTLAPWLARFMWASTPARYTATASALSHLLARAQSGYDAMLAEADLQRFVRPQECLYLYSSASAFQGARETLALRRRLGVEADILDAEAIAQLEPQLSPIFHRGALFKGSWHLSDPSAFLHALLAYLQTKGLVVHPLAVTGVQADDRQVRVRGLDHDSAYDYLALCAGVHSKDLAAQCGDDVPLQAERGYHLMFPGSTPLISRPVGWAERGFYMTPMAQGLRVAGTVELAGLGQEMHPGLLDLLHFASRRALPALGAPQAPWLGFRPTLPDGLPVLGRSRKSARVVYAFGHQHIGLTLGGLSGSLVADIVGERPSALNLDAFAAQRF